MLAAKIWTLTVVSASCAVVLAGAGLVAPAIFEVPAALSLALLGGSLAATAAAFTGLALRVRRLEMENMGLIEEISQEFDRVKDKMEIFGEALEAPRTLAPEETLTPVTEPSRRVMVK